MKRPPLSALSLKHAFILASALSICAHAREIHVSPSGSDVSPGTSEDPVRTIQRGVNLAGSGDTVLVRAGVYGERVSISGKSGSATAPIVIKSYPGERAALDLSGFTPTNGQSAAIRVHSCNHVTVQDFEIRDYKTSTNGAVPVGIWITGSGTGVRIAGNKVHDIWHSNPALFNFDSNAHGILVAGASSAPISGLIIEGNEIYNLRLGSSEALVLNGNVEGFVVRHNVVHDCNNIGIDFIGYEGTNPNAALDYARNGICAQNTVYNIDSQFNPAYGGNFGGGGGNATRGVPGIYVDGGSGIVIERNHVFSCNFGIEVGSEHAGRNASRITVRNNLVRRNHVGGIFMGGYEAGLGGISSCSFTHNTLFQNDTAGFGGGQIAIQHNVSSTVIKHNIIVCNPSTRQFILQNNSGNGIAAGAIDWNLYAGVSGTAVEFMWRRQPTSSFNAWRIVARQDAHSILTASAGFADSTGGDFRLTATSAALNRGDPSYLLAVGEVDYFGKARLHESRVDIGMSEYGAPQAIGPDVRTGSAEVESYHTATITGFVNPGDRDAQVWFEYGTSFAYGQKTPVESLPAGDASTPFSATLTGLLPRRTYHFRIVGANVTSVNGGLDRTFTTPAMPPPVITSSPVSQLVSAGQSVTFTGSATGGGPLTLRWRKNGSALPAAIASSETLNLPSVSFSQAASYTLAATNPGGTVFTTPATLAVVSTTPVTLTANEGSPLTLAARASAPKGSLSYRWLKDEAFLSDDARVTGSQTAILSIKACTEQDAGRYECEVSLGQQTLRTGLFAVTVRLRPVIQAVDTAPPWRVSGNISGQVHATQQASLYKATGLPTGVTLDSRTGALSGRPTKPGSYAITFQASNPAGPAPPFTITLSVIPIPTLVTGSFVGLIQRSSSLQQRNLGGCLRLSVSTAGGVTGSVKVGAISHAFSTTLDHQPAGPMVLRALIARGKTLPSWLLLGTIDPTTGQLLGTLSGPAEPALGSVSFGGRRLHWNAKTAPATLHAGSFNLLLNPDAATENVLLYPQGISHGSLVISTAGTATGALKLSDGSTVAVSSSLDALAALPLYLTTHSGTGSVQGWMQLGRSTTSVASSDIVDGDLSWLRLSSTSSAVRQYQTGIPQHQLTAAGGRWQKLARTTAILGLTTLPGAGEVEIPLTEEDSVHPGQLITQAFTLQPGQLADIPRTVSNPKQVSLTINPTTGHFSGQFVLRDEDPAALGDDIIRVVKFTGVVLLPQAEAHGFCLVPALPNPFSSPRVTSATSPIRSCRVSVWGIPALP